MTLETSFNDVNWRLLCARPLGYSDEWDFVLLFKALKVYWEDKDVQNHIISVASSR